MWWVQWRVFHMACSEPCRCAPVSALILIAAFPSAALHLQPGKCAPWRRYNAGNEWGVAHYVFTKSADKGAGGGQEHANGTA